MGENGPEAENRPESTSTQQHKQQQQRQSEAAASSILCERLVLPTKTRLGMEIVDWSTAAIWRWNAVDDCGICRNAFDACCADCRAPGDQCPLVWGQCRHAFHLHCIKQWCEAQTERPRCPMCRQVWTVAGQ